MFKTDNIAKGDKLFKAALASYDAGLKQIEADNAADLAAAQAAEEAAAKLREEVTVKVAGREKEKARVTGAIANLKALVGLE